MKADINKHTVELYMRDFTKAMRGQAFARTVIKTIKSVLPLMTADELLELFQIMMDTDNQSMRKSFSSYIPSQDVAIYNSIMNEIMKRPSGEIEKARMNYNPDYISLNPYDFFKKG